MFFGGGLKCSALSNHRLPGARSVKRQAYWQLLCQLAISRPVVTKIAAVCQTCSGAGCLLVGLMEHLLQVALHKSQSGPVGRTATAVRPVGRTAFSSWQARDHDAVRPTGHMRCDPLGTTESNVRFPGSFRHASIVGTPLWSGHA